MTRLDCVLGSAATVRAALTQAHPPRPAPAGLRRAAGRPAAHAERARRPGGRERGGDGAGRSGWPPPWTPGSRRSCGWRAPRRSSGSASGRRASSPRRWRCSAATATSRSRACPRLYRQSPLNSIWEGSGNVIALDVLRAMGRSSDTLAAVTAEIELARGADTRFDDAVKRLHAELGDPDAAALPGAPDRRAAGAVPAGLAAAAARAGGGRRRVLRLSPGRGLGRRARHAARPARPSRKIVERASVAPV